MKKVAMLLAATLAFGGCAGSDESIGLSAHFDDVGDLTASAPVMMADVQIGKVEDIRLEDSTAIVTISVDRSAGVPQGVKARIRRQSLLGERILDLVVPPGLPLDAPLLEEGDVITRTEIRPDLEDLVREGVHVLQPIAASEVATLIEEGAKGFGGKGEELGLLLDNFRAIVDAYASRTGQIRSVIDSLNEFNATLAPRADAQARSVANTSRAIRVLREESDRLEAAVRALARLSVGSRSILDEHSDEMDRFFRQLRVILQVLREEEGSIRSFLRWAPNHNGNTQITEYRDFVQVYQDFIFCGLNEDDQDPARNCKGTQEP